MITIVMTYFQRPLQLLKTLESFRQYDPKEFSVVIVDDGSDGENIRNIICHPKLPFDVRLITITNKSWSQGDPAYNIGFHYALMKDPEIIIIQNAECAHAGNILEYAKKVTDESYISFGCYSLGENDPFEVKNNRHIAFDGDNAWYNHPLYWPCGYHFCSAITAKNLIKLNGFDERFSLGMGYDDDDFLSRVKRLGLKVEITSEPFVYHQWHYSNRLPNYSQLLMRNLKIYEEMQNSLETKAQHVLTHDL